MEGGNCTGMWPHRKTCSDWALHTSGFHSDIQQLGEASSMPKQTIKPPDIKDQWDHIKKSPVSWHSSLETHIYPRTCLPHLRWHWAGRTVTKRMRTKRIVKASQDCL